MKRPLPPPSRPRRPRNSLTTAELLAGLHPNFYPRMREMYAQTEARHAARAAQGCYFMQEGDRARREAKP